ncbi:DUF2855 family protein [Pseudomonas sp. NFX15]|uniref:DUF2855 family protein n=1 Tax=Pseudomonas sp. NFX15 TaxID=2816958 RepID=UPI003BA0C284
MGTPPFEFPNPLFIGCHYSCGTRHCDAAGDRTSCFAGSAQSTGEARLTAIEGPQPVFFFAPIQIRKRNAEWGPEGVSQHIGEGLVEFFRQVTGGEKPLMEVIESRGYEAAQTVISRLFHGQVPPVEGHVIRL